MVGAAPAADAAPIGAAHPAAAAADAASPRSPSPENVEPLTFEEALARMEQQQQQRAHAASPAAAAPRKRQRRLSAPAALTGTAVYRNLSVIADAEEGEDDDVDIVEVAFEEVAAEEGTGARGMQPVDQVVQPPQLFAMQNLPLIARADSELSIVTANSDRDEVRRVGCAREEWLTVAG